MTPQTRKTLIYIVSSVDQASYFEVLTPYLRDHNYDVEYLILSSGETILERNLKKDGVRVTRIPFRNNRQFPLAIWQIYRYLRTHSHYAVHTHLFEAGLAGIVAAQLAGSKRRICTRWHSNMHMLFHPHAVKYDRLCNRLATHIITPSVGTKQFLVGEEHVAESKVYPNEIGFDLSQFEDIPVARIEPLRNKYNPNRRSPCIGVIARHTEWKGVHYIVEAFIHLHKDFPNAHLILANAKGDYKHVIDKLLAKLPNSSYTEISFEQDIHALYKIFDLFAHTPIDRYGEPGGQVFIEPMISGIPCVFTLSGVILNFAKDQKYCKIVDYKNADQIYEAFSYLLRNPDHAKTIAANGQSYVRLHFNAQNKMQELLEYYEAFA